LIEVLIATVIVTGALGALIGAAMGAANVRAKAEVRRIALTTAHARAIEFSRGLIYPNIANDPSQTAIVNPIALEFLPGGLPVRSAKETIAIDHTNRSATITVELEVDSVSIDPVTVSTRGLRYW